MPRKKKATVTEEVLDKEVALKDTEVEKVSEIDFEITENGVVRHGKAVMKDGKVVQTIIEG